MKISIQCFDQNIILLPTSLPLKHRNLGPLGYLDGQCLPHMGQQDLPDVVPAGHPQQGTPQPLLH